MVVVSKIKNIVTGSLNIQDNNDTDMIKIVLTTRIKEFGPGNDTEIDVLRTVIDKDGQEQTVLSKFKQLKLSSSIDKDWLYSDKRKRFMKIHDKNDTESIEFRFIITSYNTCDGIIIVTRKRFMCKDENYTIEVNSDDFNKIVDFFKSYYREVQ